MTEFPVPEETSCCGPVMVDGPDGNMWWGSSTHINRVTPAGVVTQFTPPDPSPSIVNIANGPDGNLWYLVYSSPAGGPTVVHIAKMTTAGATIAEYVLNNNDNGITSLAPGPDGNMWVLYKRGDYLHPDDPNVAKVTTAGAVTYYVMKRLSYSNQIMAGPGGRMYWVDRNNASIENFLPSDPVGSFQSVPARSGGYTMTVGSDGNLWQSIVDNYPAVGRLTPAGQETVFANSNDAGVQMVALGPDGNVWYDGQLRDDFNINRIKPDGTEETFPLPPSGSPFDGKVAAMGAGSDGTLWYVRTLASGPVVGHIDPGDGVSNVLNLPSGFSRKTITTPGPGTNVGFVFSSPGSATATDTTGLGLFDSGSQSIGSVFNHTFTAAGSYPYVDTLHPSHTGTIDVPPTIDHRQTYVHGHWRVTWATAPPPDGFVYDVQRMDPLYSPGSFADYITGTTNPDTVELTFGPPGPYSYRARLRRLSDGVATGYSSAATIILGNYTADFDVPGCGAARCGGADFAVYRPSSGVWYGNPVSGAFSTQWGAAGDIPVPGDYDGDGMIDLAVYRPSNGVWYRNNSMNGPDSPMWGTSTDIPVPGDYDGDGKTDLAVFRPSSGAWYIQPSGGGAATAALWGASGDIPVPADYDGDGKTDLAVYRPSEGRWYVMRSSDGSTFAQVFGTSTDVPVPADYDGDGKADLAIWRASDGSFTVNPSSGPPAVSVTSFFVANDIPAPGDYDSDGRTDFAVMRPGANDTWYVKQSNGGDISTVFGTTGDVNLALLPSVNQKFYLPPPVAAAQQKK